MARVLSGTVYRMILTVEGKPQAPVMVEAENANAAANEATASLAASPEYRNREIRVVSTTEILAEPVAPPPPPPPPGAAAEEVVPPEPPVEV